MGARADLASPGLLPRWLAGGGAAAWAAPADRAPVVPGFRMLRRIGAGRRSVAWLAHDLQRGGEVVLKLVPRSGGLRAFSFAGEFALAREHAHENLIRVVDHGCTAEHAWLAMEYLECGDLVRRMRRRLAPAEALALAAQVARGLAPLHRAGWVHRDVKPANCLLRRDGRLVLADLGLAAPCGQVEPLARRVRVVGTPRYVAPEQLQGAPLAPAADVYSLGVLLHELLSGRPPFTGETLMEVLAQHLVAPAPRLPAGCAGWQPLVDALLARDPARRLPHADAVLERLAAEGAGPAAPEPAGATGKGGNRDIE